MLYADKKMAEILIEAITELGLWVVPTEVMMERLDDSAEIEEAAMEGEKSTVA
jgi:hypothetical protein